MEKAEALVDLLRKVAVPLFVIDRAEIYVVAASPSEVHLHLGGAYSGCPGLEFVEHGLLAPLVADVFAKASLKITSGFPLPKDARRVAIDEPSA
ncbi:MAG: hypothetical protein K0S65_1872 [Labilithrix sp.]|nr:hypothetical protein [Labilithrix sp.]